MFYEAFEEWKASSCCFPCHQSIEEWFKQMESRNVEAKSGISECMT